MKFKEWIENKENYNSCCKMGHYILQKSFKGNSNYLLNQEEKEDIIQNILLDLLIKNEEVYNTNSFLKGYFAIFCKFSGMNYLNSKHKKKLHYPKMLKSDLKWNEYSSESTDFIDKQRKDIRIILEDKFYNELSGKELKEKYNVSMSKIYQEIRNKGKKSGNIKKKCLTMKKGVDYVGVIRSKEGEPNKYYHCLVDVKKDGFRPSKVGDLCRGTCTGKTHLGYNWKFNLKTQENG